MRVVIDKSFIQAKSEPILATSQLEFDFVVTENLLYETCKADADERRSISRKLLSLPNKTYYTSVTKILAHEAEALSPFDVNKLPSAQASTALLEEMSKADTVTENIRLAIDKTERHYERLYAEYVPHLESWRDRTIEEIIFDTKSSAGKRFPDLPMNSSWGTYNLIACLKHYAENISARYEHSVLFGRPLKRVIHDLLDIDYAVLAIVCGGIATRDNGIINCLKTVCDNRLPRIIS